MQDPSQGISRELAPHVHLISNYRYPQLLSVHPDKVVEWLLEAPKITRNQSPFYWTYLDRPTDGSIYLTWQSPALGTEFASDGYIWAQPESRYPIEVPGGYTLEMLHYRTGFAPGEPMATHSRRRYRLHPSPNGGASPDTSLWIIHYLPAEPNDRVPSQMVPVDARIQQTMTTRQYLHSQGQIVQKEFMLHDRANWPQIAFPRNQPRGPAMYGGNLPPARVPQNMAYPAHQGPPAKRPRTNTTGTQPPANNAVAVHDMDDEEDTARGDLFDHTTPREISITRYKQNHEWMEEILSSPYSINQILPADLGLGLRGQLATVTDGIFDAPVDPDKDVARFTYIGQLDKEKAEEFRKRTSDRIAQSNKDIEKMKAKHAKRLAKFRKGATIIVAEKDLRSAVNEPSDVGPEYWRLEGRIDSDDEEEAKASQKVPTKVADIIAKVEASVGRHAAAVKELVRIQDGGFEEPVAIPSPEPPAVQSAQVSPPASNNGSTNSGVLIGDADIDMGGSAAGLLDQFHTGLSSNATPNSNFPTPQAHLQAQSSAGTPSNMLAASPQPPAPAAEEQTAQPDITMEDASGSGEQAQQDAGTKDDWVVIPPGGESPKAPAEAAPETVQAPETTSANDTPSAPVIADPSPLPTGSANETPLPDFQTSENDFAGLEDLETAGFGDDLGMDMDDSAFGDAFHGTEPNNEDNGDAGM